MLAARTLPHCGTRLPVLLLQLVVLQCLCSPDRLQASASRMLLADSPYGSVGRQLACVGQTCGRTGSQVEGKTDERGKVTRPGDCNCNGSSTYYYTAPGAAGQRVRAPRDAPSLPYPLSAVGQLRNGCTAFLVGPCHALTVAHCVYDPPTDTWWPGLEFSPGRDGDGRWEPYGTATWTATEVPDGWRRGSGAGDPSAVQYDYALVVLAEAIGRRVGWMQVGGGYSNGEGPAEGSTVPAATGGAVKEGQGTPPTPDHGGTSGRALKGLDAYGGKHPASALRRRGLQQQVQAQALVTVAGYPDDKENGTLWAETCTLDLGAGAGNGGGSQGLVAGGAQAGVGPPPLRTHNCHTRGGNSGSPLWVQLREVPTGPCRCAVTGGELGGDSSCNGGGSSSDASGCGRDCKPGAAALAMHVAGETTSKYDAGGRLYGTKSTGLAVSLDGPAGAWVRDALAKHSGC